MPWVPIEESAVGYSFVPEGSFASVTLIDSVVSGADVGGLAGNWEIEVPAGTLFRVTAISFSSNDSAGSPSFFQNDAETVFNTNAVDNPAFWTPSPFEMPAGDYLWFEFGFQEQTGSFEFLVEVWEEAPPEAERCEELGRVTRSYVSGYDRARVHVGTVRRQERRCVVANFNGAIPPGRSIASVVWRCTSPWVTFMRDPSIFERDAQVVVDFQNPGWGALKATVTLDNGEIYNQTFEYTVRDAPWFMENYAPIAGPYTVTATAP
jgi:hypothetical protein